MKRAPSMIAAAVLGAGSFVFGQATTMPSQAPPAESVPMVQIQPSAPQVQPTAAPWRVLVQPFKLIGNTSGREWVAEAIQENLSAAVSSTPGLSAIDGSPVANRADAIAAARNAGAALVITGSCELTDTQIRAIGQVDDVQTGLTLGTLKSTGNSGDMFRIEDDLTSQLAAVLPQPPGAAQAQPPVTEAPAEVAPPSQQYVYPAQPYIYNYGYTPDYYYPDYGYDYGYPYYGYYGFYPGIYGGFGYGRFGFRGGYGFHGGGFHGGGFGGGFHGGGFGGGGFHGGGGGGGHGR